MITFDVGNVAGIGTIVWHWEIVHERNIHYKDICAGVVYSNFQGCFIEPVSKKILAFEGLGTGTIYWGAYLEKGSELLSYIVNGSHTVGSHLFQQLGPKGVWISETILKWSAFHLMPSEVSMNIIIFEIWISQPDSDDWNFYFTLFISVGLRKRRQHPRRLSCNKPRRWEFLNNILLIPVSSSYSH